MGRSMPKLSYFSPPYSGEEKMLLHLEVAGKALYVLGLVVLLLLYLQKLKRNRRGGRHVQTTNRVNVVHGDNGGETIRGRIARRVRAGCQYAGEVRYDAASDEPDEDIAVGGTINGEIAMGRTAIAAVGASDEELAVGGTINGETVRGRIARRVRAGGQYAGEVHFDVAGDDDGGTINGEIAMAPTAIAAAIMPFEFN